MQDIVFCERIYCMDEVPSHEQSSRDFVIDQNAHIEKKTRKRLNNGVLPARGAHRNAIGSDFVWLQ